LARSSCAIWPIFSKYSSRGAPGVLGLVMSAGDRHVAGLVQDSGRLVELREQGELERPVRKHDGRR
jgi:hypothetical protein